MAKIDPKYISAWRRRFDAFEAESQEIAARARADLNKAVPILRSYGAKRILLFGSLCCSGRFHPGSDIDLAVEGIPVKDVTRAAASGVLIGKRLISGSNRVVQRNEKKPVS